MGKKFDRCVYAVTKQKGKYNPHAVCTKAVGRLNAKKSKTSKKIPSVFFNKFGMLFGVYNKKKKEGVGFANPFKISPLQALGLRPIPKKITKGVITKNFFTGR